MRYEMLHPGSSSLLKVYLDYGETIKAESGAMVAMSPTLDVGGQAEGGILKGLGRMLAGEKFFFQTITASRGPGEVLLAPSTPGEIYPIELNGSYNYTLQKDGFFVGTSGVDISTQMQNLTKGLFSGEGFFVVKASGTGLLFVSSFGAIHAIDIPPGGEFVIDNSHLVAWPETTQYKIEKASSGWFSSLKSGEVLVCRFYGPGRVLIQTRNPQAFGQWIRGFVSPSSGGGGAISTITSLID